MSLAALAAAAIALTLASCAVGPAADSAAARAAPIGFIAVGDTGLHYDYLDPDDVVADAAAFLALERAEWAEDRRPPEDFRAGAMAILPDGRVTAASGLVPVSRAIRAWCASADCAFALMLGDNVYPDGLTLGADGHDDAGRLRKLFVEPFGDFGADRDGFRFYATLGNHDWKTSREAALAQVRFLEHTQPFYMDGLYYRMRPAAGHGDVEVFVIDTSVLLAGTDVHEAELTEDGHETVLPELEDTPEWVRPHGEGERAMAAWLEQALASSTARWKIVMGHHPLWSSAGSKFEQSRVLRSLILPALCKYADLYFAGHEHTLEAHVDDCAHELGGTARPLLSVVSGAGAKQRPLHRTFMANQEALYPQHRTLYSQGLVWGFAHVLLDGDEATVTLVSTPNDGSARTVEEFRTTTPRRSTGRAAAAD